MSVGPLHSKVSVNITIYFNSCENALNWNGHGLGCSLYGGCVLHDDHIVCVDSDISDCSFGYMTGHITDCTFTSFFCILPGSCLTVDHMSGSLIAGSCPYTYGDHSTIPMKKLVSLHHEIELSNLTCAPHREGRLCGRCTEGYGVAFNSYGYSCIKCEWYGGVVFVSVELLPVLIMMIILSVLHIKITDGCLNGFVLYSQLLTLQFPGLTNLSEMYNKNILYTYNIVYSIWNLNFLTLYPEPFCIPHADTAVKAIALQYVIAVFPLLFIVLSYIWVQLYSRGNSAALLLAHQKESSTPLERA